MVSFRIEDDEASRATAWADRLGMDRSQLIRDALRRHLDHLAAVEEAASWVDDEEHEHAVAALAGAAEWGPAEDWSDWLVSFDNIHTLPRIAFRRQVVRLSEARMTEACRVMAAATGC